MSCRYGAAVLCCIEFTDMGMQINVILSTAKDRFA